MARKYNVICSDTCFASTTIAGITSATTIRPMLYDIEISSRAALADDSAGYSFRRYTGAGTSTPVTPQAIDSGDPASLASAGQAHTGEPTYTAGATLFELAVNRRSLFRWVSAVGGELKMPATAANGIGCFVTGNSGAFAVEVTIHFEE